MNIHLRTCTRSLRSSTTSTSIGLGHGHSHGHIDVAGPSRSNVNFKQVSSSTSPLSARQYLGRITPKRIAVSRSSLDPSHPSYLPSSSSSSSSSYGSASGSYDGLPRRSIWRPIVFCALFGGGSYTLLALYTNYDTQKWTDKLSKSSSMTSGVGWWKSSHVPSNREMQRAKQLEGAKSAQKTLNTLPTTLSFLPNIILVPILRMYVMGSEFYLNTPSSQLAPIGLISGMSLVFLSWKVQRGRWQGFMRKWWLHHPVLIPSASASGGPAGLNSIKRKEWASCVTLFTSTLSHQSLPHLAFNSLALFSFGSASYAYLSSSPSLPNLPTSTHTPHFLGFLLVAGLFSSLSSHIYTNLFRLPKLLKSLRSPGRLSSALALANQQSILPSLGASGAIYSALTLTALAFPDSNVGIIFLPFVKFPIGAGVAGMVALDLVGLIRGWRLFDHTAHLAGALFGVLYYGYGRQTWTWLRRQMDFSHTHTRE